MIQKPVEYNRQLLVLQPQRLHTRLPLLSEQPFTDNTPHKEVSVILVASPSLSPSTMRQPGVKSENKIPPKRAGAAGQRYANTMKGKLSSARSRFRYQFKKKHQPPSLAVPKLSIEYFETSGHFSHFTDADRLNLGDEYERVSSSLAHHLQKLASRWNEVFPTNPMGWTNLNSSRVRKSLLRYLHPDHWIDADAGHAARTFASTMVQRINAYNAKEPIPNIVIKMYGGIFSPENWQRLQDEYERSLRLYDEARENFVAIKLHEYETKLLTMHKSQQEKEETDEEIEFASSSSEEDEKSESASLNKWIREYPRLAKLHRKWIRQEKDNDPPVSSNTSTTSTNSRDIETVDGNQAATNQPPTPNIDASCEGYDASVDSGKDDPTAEEGNRKRRRGKDPHCEGNPIPRMGNPTPRRHRFVKNKRNVEENECRASKPTNGPIKWSGRVKCPPTVESEAETECSSDCEMERKRKTIPGTINNSDSELDVSVNHVAAAPGSIAAMKQEQMRKLEMKISAQIEQQRERLKQEGERKRLRNIPCTNDVPSGGRNDIPRRTRGILRALRDTTNARKCLWGYV